MVRLVWLIMRHLAYTQVRWEVMWRGDVTELPGGGGFRPIAKWAFKPPTPELDRCNLGSLAALGSQRPPGKASPPRPPGIREPTRT